MIIKKNDKNYIYFFILLWLLYYLFNVLKDPKMRKYAIKKPSNLKTILTVDEWARTKAMAILKSKIKWKKFL